MGGGITEGKHPRGGRSSDRKRLAIENRGNLEGETFDVLGGG